MAKEPVGASPEDAFIREVDEEFRRDQLAGFWTRYGRTLLIVIGLGLVALAAFLWWREEQAKKLGLVSEQFAAAQQGLEMGDAKAKAEIQRFAAGDYGGYTYLARFTQAAQAAENGDNAGALATYNAIAADSGLPQPLRELATVKAVRLQYDDLPPARVAEQLKPLVKPGAPWFGLAGEMLALSYMRDGKSELAGPIFAAISADETLAPSLRDRAQQMAASLGSLPTPEFGADGSPVATPATPAAAAAAAPATEKN